MTWVGLPNDWQKYKGMVYIITHLPSGKFYVGKKLFWFKKRKKPLKGKRRSRIEFVESDFRTYYGSSNDFCEFVQKEGKDNFERRVVRLCQDKWEMSYYELLEQLKYDVLHNPLSYNGIINVRLRRRK